MAACWCDDTCTCSSGWICPCAIGTCACVWCYNVVEDIPVSFWAWDVQDSTGIDEIEDAQDVKVDNETQDLQDITDPHDWSKLGDFTPEEIGKFNDIFGKLDLSSAEDTPDDQISISDEDLKWLKEKFTD